MKREVRARAARDVAGRVLRLVQGLAYEAREAQGLKRNAAVVLGNGDAADDVEHEHAVWALERIAACLRHVMLPRVVDASGE